MRTGKFILFSLIPSILLAIIFEVAFRTYYFIKEKPVISTFAVQQAYYQARNRIQKSRASADFSKVIGIDITPQQLSKIEGELSAVLYQDENAGLLQHFRDEYKTNFDELIKEIKRTDAHIVMLYIPCYFPNDKAKMEAQKEEYQFFKSIAGSHHIDFVDTTSAFEKHGMQKATLYPKDTHLNHTGCELTAAALYDYLITKEKNLPKTKDVNVKAGELMGDCPVKMDGDILWRQDMPFRLISNQQGLRNIDDIPAEKQKKRILVLGDSFTFGPYISNEDTYPYLLEQKLGKDKWIVANAGWLGYTITDELTLYKEKGYRFSPDVVIIQVLFNDVYGMFGCMQGVFSRNKENNRNITKEEKNILERLLKDD